ncbi:hypothetical protein IU450_15305 [Nocardia abscessus]|uniref:hypothetical protein n=1 Tax=Nocardia abscessus TaxID=120957 RepID=UPI001894890D|nr:hypothetical protein [Nocardia abscessus]MBF6337251.1 hypothetical protein [Nocardia abscessus]
MPDELSNGSSEIAALAQQVETARGKLPLQLDPALLQVLSEREIAAERELAEWIRAQRRKQRRREVEAELAAEQRDRKSAAALRRSDDADARWHRRALAARRRVSSADARLAQLYRRAEWSSRALIAVVVLGMVWAGVNVQHNLVPSGDMSDPLYWLSYGIEAMISIPIITIMVAATTAARWGRELARGKVIFFEAALLGTTVALNTGPHLAAGDLGRTVEYAIAPVMVGVVIWLHAWVSARYAVLIDGAPVIDRDPQAIRIDARRTSGMPDGGDHHSLEGAGTAANGGRFHWEEEISTAPLNSGREPEHASPAGLREVRGNQSAGSNTPVTPRTYHAEPSAINGHAIDSPINGHAVTAPVGGHPLDRSVLDHDPVEAANPESAEVHARYTTSGPAERFTDGHAVETHPNDAAFPQAPNGYPVEPTVDGHTYDVSVNGHAVLPVDGRTTRAAANGNAYHPPTNGNNGRPAINGHTPPNVHAHPLQANGHIVRPTTNGHTVKTPTNGNAHPAQTNGHTLRPSTTSHTNKTPTNGNAHPAQTNGHTLHPTTTSHTNKTPTNGNAHPAQANGHTLRPTANGHTNETPANGNTHSPQTNGHTAPPITDGPTTDSSANGDAPHRQVDSVSSANGPRASGPGDEHLGRVGTVQPATNGHDVDGDAHSLQIDGHSVRPTTGVQAVDSSPTGDAHALQGGNVPSTDGPLVSRTRTGHHGHTTVRATNGHTAEITTDIDAQALPVTSHSVAPGAENRTDNRAADGSQDPSVGSGQEVSTPAPNHLIASFADPVPDVAAEPMTRPAEPAQPFPADAERAALGRAEAPASIDPKPRLDPARPSAPQQISLDDLHEGFEFDERPVAQAGNAAPQANFERGERPLRGNDAARHPGSGAADPMPATTDTAAQVNPNATAPRAAQRGKSLSAEQNDRSADAESEQLALEQAPLRTEALPILDAEDDEDDEFPAEPEEAATDDDEISAIARAITGRRLSTLPIEEVREILTLADQGGSTPAIANELGVSRSAVTRVLDSAIKVHRPYAVIG